MIHLSMSATKKATDDRKEIDRKEFYWACNCRAALEVYLQPFADAKRFDGQLESKAAQLERETSDTSKRSALERPFFDKGGFGGKKLHRSTVRTLINLARENARVFLPVGPQYQKEGNREKKLSEIAEDGFVILAYQAVLEGNGDFFRVVAEVVEEDARSIRETLDHPLRYQVELAHKAALELVREAHVRCEAGEEEPYDEIEGLRCFVPMKQQVKTRVMQLFRKERIRGERRQRKWTKPNPKDWSDSMWTKIFTSAGLTYLKEARGRPRTKRRKAVTG